MLAAEPSGGQVKLSRMDPLERIVRFRARTVLAVLGIILAVFALLLVISLARDPRFELRGDDLHTKIRAPFTTLLLGGEAHVTTPDGRTLALSIPADTQDGRSFRLRGQGMPRLGKSPAKGDLHAEVHAELPTHLSDRERELLEEFQRAGAGTAGAAR